MKTVCEPNQCAGCMACAEICARNAITIQDTLSAYNAVINEKVCVDCQLCHKICPQNSVPELVEPKEWCQGWVKDGEIRGRCSSGGFATAISMAFTKSGGYVYSCIFDHGEFRFQKAAEASEVQKFAGSKYVKSNPAGVYRAIKTDLQKGSRVLFIGLPCQVAAVKNYVGAALAEKLYTADLICHGTPSPKLLDIFLKQYGKDLNSLHAISFRVKAKMQIHGNYKGIVAKGVSDRYTIAFLNGLTYTDNCYTCQYAQRKRVSDITLGDAWGSDLPLEHQKDGISLALCQTEKGAELLGKADIQRFDVNLETAISKNQQLDHPTPRPVCRSDFLRCINEGGNFNKKVKKHYSKQCFKQDVKKLLIRMNVISMGSKGRILDYGIQYKEDGGLLNEKLSGQRFDRGLP